MVSRQTLYLQNHSTYSKQDFNNCETLRSTFSWTSSPTIRQVTLLQTGSGRTRWITRWITSLRLPVPWFSLRKLYISSWLAQNLSNRLLKQFTVSAITTWPGKEFHILTILLEKKYFRRSYFAQRFWCIFRVKERCWWHSRCTVWNIKKTTNSVV